MLLQPHVVLVVHCETLHHERYDFISQKLHTLPFSILHTRTPSDHGKTPIHGFVNLCTNTTRVESAGTDTTLIIPHLQNVRLYSHSGVDDFSRYVNIRYLPPPPPTQSMIWRDVVIRSPSYFWFSNCHSLHSLQARSSRLHPARDIFRTLPHRSKCHTKLHKQKQCRSMPSLFWFIEQNKWTTSIQTIQCCS